MDYSNHVSTNVQRRRAFMIKRIGNRTLCFEEQPVIIGHAAIAGKKESEGPLSNFFDRIIYDIYNGLDTFEDAESRMQAEAVSLATIHIRNNSFLIVDSITIIKMQM